MKMLKLWTKFSYVISLVLSLFYGLSGVFLIYLGKGDDGLKAFLMAGAFFVISLVLKKSLGQNKSLNKMMQSVAYIYSKHQGNYDLHVHRLLHLLYIFDWVSSVKGKSVFHDSSWSFDNGLSNKAFDAIKSFLPKLDNLKRNNLDPLFMIPSRDLSADEISNLDFVLSYYNQKNPVELQQLIQLSSPLLDKQYFNGSLEDTFKANMNHGFFKELKTHVEQN